MNQKEALLKVSNEVLSQRIRSLCLAQNNRFQRKIKQKELASVLEKSDQIAGYICRGKQTVSLEDAIKMSYFFGLTLENFLFETSIKSDSIVNTDNSDLIRELERKNKLINMLIDQVNA